VVVEASNSPPSRRHSGRVVPVVPAPPLTHSSLALDGTPLIAVGGGPGAVVSSGPAAAGVAVASFPVVAPPGSVPHQPGSVESPDLRSEPVLAKEVSVAQAPGCLVAAWQQCPRARTRTLRTLAVACGPLSLTHDWHVLFSCPLALHVYVY
jgi:hypothetical protein